MVEEACLRHVKFILVVVADGVRGLSFPHIDDIVVAVFVGLAFLAQCRLHVLLNLTLTVDVNMGSLSLD